MEVPAAAAAAGASLAARPASTPPSSHHHHRHRQPAKRDSDDSEWSMEPDASDSGSGSGDDGDDLRRDDASAARHGRRQRTAAAQRQQLTPGGAAGSDGGRGRSRQPRGAWRQVRWTAEEDAALVALVEEYGPEWKALEAHMAGRSGKKCRERYLNHLQPGIRKGGWTLGEEYQLALCHAAAGPAWSAMRRRLAGRTENGIKNYFHSRARCRTPAKRAALLSVYVAGTRGGLSGAQALSAALTQLQQRGQLPAGLAAHASRSAEEWEAAIAAELDALAPEQPAEAALAACSPQDGTHAALSPLAALLAAGVLAGLEDGGAPGAAAAASAAAAAAGSCAALLLAEPHTTALAAAPAAAATVAARLQECARACSGLASPSAPAVRSTRLASPTRKPLLVLDLASPQPDTHSPAQLRCQVDPEPDYPWPVATAGVGEAPWLPAASPGRHQQAPAWQREAACALRAGASPFMAAASTSSNDSDPLGCAMPRAAAAMADNSAGAVAAAAAAPQLHHACSLQEPGAVLRHSVPALSPRLRPAGRCASSPAMLSSAAHHVTELLPHSPAAHCTAGPDLAAGGSTCTGQDLQALVQELLRSQEPATPRGAPAASHLLVGGAVPAAGQVHSCFAEVLAQAAAPPAVVAADAAQWQHAGAGGAALPDLAAVANAATWQAMLAAAAATAAAGAAAATAAACIGHAAGHGAGAAAARPCGRKRSRFQGRLVLDLSDPHLSDAEDGQQDEPAFQQQQQQQQPLGWPSQQGAGGGLDVWDCGAGTAPKLPRLSAASRCSAGASAQCDWHSSSAAPLSPEQAGVSGWPVAPAACPEPACGSTPLSAAMAVPPLALLMPLGEPDSTAHAAFESPWRQDAWLHDWPL